MQKTLIHSVVWTIAFVCFRTATATEKVDISKVITKADAEAVLGVPVEDRSEKTLEIGFLGS